MFMQKRCIGIVIVFCWCAVNNNVFGGSWYDVLQNGIGFLIDHIVPDIKDENRNLRNNIDYNNVIENDNINTNSIDIDNEINNNIMNDGLSPKQLYYKINTEAFNQDFQNIGTNEQKWVKLIELHYVWCAFYGTAIVKTNLKQVDQLGDLGLLNGIQPDKVEKEAEEEYMDIAKITLDSKIIDFFSESKLKKQYMSTLDGLKGVFAANVPPYNDNFIEQKTTFRGFIRTKLQDIIQQDCELGNIFNVLLNDTSELGEKALWWMFSVTLGLYYQIAFAELVDKKMNNGFFYGDRYKQNSAAYIVKSSQERAVLFQKFISYFKFLYCAFNEGNNDALCRYVVEHMKASLQGEVYWENFKNLLYRNKDKDGRHIDLVGGII